MSAKKYDVYAIGNAIVDYEIEVDNAFLEANGVEKGLMTLAEQDRQDGLFYCQLCVCVKYFLLMRQLVLGSLPHTEDVCESSKGCVQ